MKVVVGSDLDQIVNKPQLTKVIKILVSEHATESVVDFYFSLIFG